MSKHPPFCSPARTTSHQLKAGDFVSEVKIMVNEEAKTKVYATIHAAMWGLNDGIVTFEEFCKTLDSLCAELETDGNIVGQRAA